MHGDVSMEWITDNDRKWVKDHYPDLTFHGESPLVLSGTLKFDMLYDPDNEEYVINPWDGHQFQGERIRDSYDVEIRFEKSRYSSLPQVFERGGRLERIAQERNLMREDMHINGNGAVCLCFQLEEQDYLVHIFCMN